MEALLPCWHCGALPTVDPNGGYPIVACRDCYDGAPDSSRRNDLGAGTTTVEAIAAWNEKAAEEEEDRRCMFGGVEGKCKNRGQSHFKGMCFFHRNDAGKDYEPGYERPGFDGGMERS